MDDMAAAPADVAIPAIVGLAGMDYAGALEDLDIPILAVNATGEPTDEAAIRRIEPRFRLVPVEGVGHFPMLESPTEFNRVLGRIVDAWAGLETERKSLSGTSGSG
jgi:pimeloyl-ACP methyl ester carboxylesterase